VCGVEVNQPAATAVDQNRAWPHAIQKCLIDQMMSFFGQGYVQRQNIACRSELRHVPRGHARGKGGNKLTERLGTTNDATGQASCDVGHHTPTPRSAALI
jgi:hypothetical protein